MRAPTAYFYLILLSLGLSSCQDPTFSIEHLSVDPTNNPSVKKVSITSSDSISVYLKLEHLRSGQVSYTHPSSPEVNHEIMLPALRPDSEYAFSVYSEGKLLTGIDTLKTERIPTGIVNIDLKRNEKESFDGYLLTQRRLVSGQAYMINSFGEVVWYQPIPGQLKLTHYTEKGEVLTLYGAPHHNNSAGDKITTYTLSGDTVYHLDLSKLSPPLIAHHEILEIEDDLLLLVYDTKEIPSPIDDQLVEVRSDALVRISRGGEILWKWSTFDVKDPEDDPHIMDHLEDWGHANAFSFDQDGNLLVSYRDWNQIWKIDAVSGALLWALGTNGDISMAAKDYFSGQHSIHINRMGDYMLFDNGRENKQSKIISFQLKDGKANTNISIDLPSDHYADRMGNAILLPNDNILVCAPRSRSVLVLDQQGSILFHVAVGIPDPYRVAYIPPFYTAESL
ncbi:MAG: aryl-sulfate sulfotransferase [Cyclobacteriaceae bacterium]